MKSYICIFLMLIITAVQCAYAECGDEWMNCRRDARSAKNDCISSCNGDLACRQECTNSLNSDYRDCDHSKADCRRSDSSRSNNSSSNYEVPRQGGSAATFCVTNYGSCGMNMSIPIGSSCICVTPAGPIAGIAR
jgi:hypothetical protein